MPVCKHAPLEPTGERKTDGVDSYFMCKGCGTLLAMTPSSRAIGVPGMQAGHPSDGGANTS